MSDKEYQPLSGDPDLLAAKATHYQSIADAISRSTTALKKIHDVDDMKSQATEALTKMADDVAKDIDKAHDRYDKTAKALLTYSHALRTAQADAQRAIADIADKQGDLDAANRAVTQAQSHADQTAQSTTAQPADQDAAKRAAARAHDHATDVGGELAAAQQRWRDARDAKTSAANTAHDAIEDVVDRHNNGLKNPSFWEKLVDAIHDVLKVICDIAGVLAIFLAWVPILGEVLIVLAAVGALLDIIDAAVALINGSGDVWGLVFAVGTAAITLFGGKIFAFAAKELRAGMVVRSGLAETRALARLEGVGAHSEEFMNLAKATEQLNKPLHTMFTSPFVRTEAQKAAMTAFKAGDKSAGELIKAAAKEAFPALDFDPGKMLGINKDLASFAKMAGERPDLVTNGMKVLGAGAVAYQSMTTVTKIVNLPGKLVADPVSTLLGGSEGDYKDMWGGVRDTGSDIPKAVRSVTDLVRG